MKHTILILSVFFFSGSLDAQIFPIDSADSSLQEIESQFEAWCDNNNVQNSKMKKHFQRWKSLNKTRVNDDGVIVSQKHFVEAHRNWMKSFSGQNEEKGNVGEWIPLGISEWQGTSTYGYNPGNGRLNCVAVDPNNTSVIYAGSPTGGLWKSIDAGQNWNTCFDSLAWVGVSSVAIDPQNSQHIYAGTGDRDGFWLEGAGLYESFDGGQTWLEAGLNVQERMVNKILINPQNPQTIFLATDEGVYRSTNGGTTYSLVYNNQKIRNLLMHPTDTSIIYGADDVLIRSYDGGQSFTDTVPGGNLERLEIAVTPAAPDYLYVITAENNGGFEALLRSTNAGQSFVQRSNSPNILGMESDGSGTGGQAWWDLALTVSPTNPDMILSGGVNAWKSVDGGQTWTLSSNWIYFGGNNYTHADIHYFFNSGTRTYCASDGGLFYSTDFGDTWMNLSAGLNISEIYRIAVSADDPAKVLIGTQDNGTNRMKDGNWTHIFGGDGMDCIFDPYDANTYYFSTQNGNLMSTNSNMGNYNNISPTTDGAWTTPMDMSAQNPSVIYAAYSSVYKSTNQGVNWASISPTFLQNGAINYLKVSPVDSDYIYAASGTNLYVTTDGGISWETISLSWGGVLNLAVSETDPERFWLICAGTQSALLESTDAGQSFENLATGNIGSQGLRCVVPYESYHDALFVGTENAVLYHDSINGWQPWVDGLPSVYVRELEINTDQTKLYAGTYGRGAWVSELPQLNASVESNDKISIKLFPNPASDNITVAGDEPIREVIMFDMSGRILRREEGAAEEIQLNVSDLVGGTYYLKIYSENGDVVKPLIVRD